MKNPIPLILVTFIVFFGLVMLKQESERQIRIKKLTKESERLDRERDSLLTKRDSLIKELDKHINELNSIN